MVPEDIIGHHIEIRHEHVSIGRNNPYCYVAVAFRPIVSAETVARRHRGTAHRRTILVFDRSR